MSLYRYPFFDQMAAASLENENLQRCLFRVIKPPCNILQNTHRDTKLPFFILLTSLLVMFCLYLAQPITHLEHFIMKLRSLLVALSLVTDGMDILRNVKMDQG